MKHLLFLILLFISANLFAQSASVILTAQASDSDGTVTSYNWTKITGPNCTISGATTSAATISFTAAGNYTFQCAVIDNQGATASAQVSGVITAANKPPVLKISPNSFSIQLK